MGKDKHGSFGWLLSQSGERRNKFILSVVLAALSMLCGIIPYYFIAGIVRDLLAGSTDKTAYLLRCGIILALWLGHALFHALSTANSHLATFHTLAVIRKKALDRLAGMPLGDVISQPSGALKSTVVERIDSIETTLAHILPEFTTGIGAPVIILICTFCISRKLRNGAEAHPLHDDAELLAEGGRHGDCSGVGAAAYCRQHGSADDDYDDHQLVPDLCAA